MKRSRQLPGNPGYTAREILEMGEARLPRVAQSLGPSKSLMSQVLINDMLDTVEAATSARVAGLQIGIDPEDVDLGHGQSECDFHAPAVPRAVLVNPRRHALGVEVIGEAELLAMLEEAGAGGSSS